jgi:cytochrome c
MAAMWRMALLLLALALPGAARTQELAGHGGPVRALLPLGPLLVSAGFDHAVILWDPGAARAIRVSRWHQAAVGALAALPDGRFASGAEDGRIALWRPGSEEPEAVLQGHAAPVVGLSARPGALASAGWDGTARLWDLAGGPVRVMEGHQGTVNGVAFLPSGALVSTGQDGTIREWAADGTPKLLAEFGTPQNALLSLADGTIASAGADGTVRLLAPDGRLLRELAAGPRPVIALAASPDGALLAAGTVGGGVGLWEVASGRRRGTLDGPGLPVWSLAFGPDGATLWSGGQDRRVRRWDAATAHPLGPLAPPANDEPATNFDSQGAQAFRACQACHALSAEAPAMAGPHLAGLFGRRMGSVAGYRYSARLARGDIVWTRETIADLFTRGPDAVTPGTTMPVQTVGNPEDLAALLRFLEQATR